MFGKIKKVLGLITDLLLLGRKAGLWEKGQGIDWDSVKKGDKDNVG